MTVNDLRDKLNFAPCEGYLTGEEEVIVLGSGDKKTGLLGLGFCLPQVVVDTNSMLKDTAGFYGIGFTKVE